MVREGRSDSLRKRHRQQIASAQPSCHICGRAIDFSLRFPDPMCFVVDHIVPISRGGSDLIENKAAAHHACNSLKRARDYAPIIRRSSSLE
jgi:5-methylcytosine-specific restriction endonuclease McrA